MEWVFVVEYKTFGERKGFISEEQIIIIVSGVTLGLPSLVVEYE
jgi:hypothetical protein